MSRDFQIKHNNSRVVPRRPLRVSSLTPAPDEPSSMQIKSEDEAEKRFWGKYYFEKVIGKGGYGLVLRIKNKLNGQLAACKIIEREKVSADIFASLREEPKFLSRLATSKHVVGLVESFESRKRMFVVMEYMKGGDLSHFIKQRLARGAAFRESEVAAIVAGILKALKAVHGNHIVHGDVKPGTLASPGNILLAEEDRFDLLKLADFGFSAVRKNDKSSSRGLFKVQAGTLSYMAPEQAQNSEAFGDLYSGAASRRTSGARA